MTVADYGRRARRAAADPALAWRTIRSRHLHGLFVDIGHDPGAAVLVAGSARSGTTWLASIINYANAYRYVFEPFRPNRLDAARAFGTRRYIRPGDDDPATMLAARDILSGRVRGRWSDQMNRKIVARRRLVKDIWANLLLGWIHEAFPQTPIVFLLRHPCAVVSSQTRLDWGWLVDVDELLRQDSLVEDHLLPQRDVLAAAVSPFQRHLVTWCVENLVPLRQLSSDRVHVMFYEHLCADPVLETERLFRFVGRPIRREHALRAVSHPSVAARSHSAVVTGRGLVDAWVSQVDPADRRYAVRTLEAFGMDGLYGEDPRPLVLAGRAGLASGAQPSRERLG